MIKDQLTKNNTVGPNTKEIEKLRKVFPHYFDKNGNFMIDRLKELLSSTDVEMSKEGYELKFLGKSYAKLLTSTETKTVLTPIVEHNTKEINAESKNVYMVGDNIDAIKHLLKSYSNEVDCIYIDPPYNTGKKDFVYPDTFEFTKEGLAKSAGIEEDEAERILNMAGKSTHSAWLTFMYPRLLLARDLLKDEGVIFISIDENEHCNLKLICDEVFGEENFAGEIIWKNSSKNDQSYISMQHEYIIAFVKNKTMNSGEWTEKKEGLEEIFKAFEGFRQKHGDDWEAIHKEALEWYKQFPESNPISSSKHYSWMDERGVYFPADISGPNYGQYRYDVTHPITGGICKEPASGWRYPEETMKQRVKDNLIHFGKDETTIPNNKTYLVDTQFQSLTSIKYKDGRVASNQLNDLLGGKYFTNPKDVDLLSLLFKAIGLDKNSLILDFFSGSASTAHAVMQMNAEDNGKRRFIMVQLPEAIEENKPAYQAGYRTIDEIGRDRIEKAAEKIKTDTNAVIDYGFKLYKLNTPEQKTLDKIVDFNPVEELVLGDMIDVFSFNNIPGKETILSTWLNEDGYGLCSKTDKMKLKTYEADLHDGSLYIIEEGITSEDIMELIKKIENNELMISRVVVYPYSLPFNQSHELKKNIANLRQNKNITVIERY
ncbi:MAG: DNA methyltransferase [Bacillota bacterium]|nr:DNA methyltransferase [Bacillota bacterium]